MNNDVTVRRRLTEENKKRNNCDYGDTSRKVEINRNPSLLVKSSLNSSKKKKKKNKNVRAKFAASTLKGIAIENSDLRVRKVNSPMYE